MARKFKVNDDIFDKIFGYSIGVIFMKIHSPLKVDPLNKALLQEQVATFQGRYTAGDIRQIPNIKAYRHAIAVAGYDPEKSPSIVEQLDRACLGAKSSQIPLFADEISNTINRVSLKYQLAIAAFDGRHIKDDDLVLRFSQPGDTFKRIGQSKAEPCEQNIPVCVAGNEVKAKIMLTQFADILVNAESRTVFIAIEGFKSINRQQIVMARDELASYLPTICDCSLKTGVVDVHNPRFNLEV